MRFGVGTARRGWMQAAHVLNTRSVDEVRAFVARKRARAWRLTRPESTDRCHCSSPRACVVATIAFWAYTRTLLPGVDLGDTGGFQAAVLWPENSARRAYPLYYTLATPFVSRRQRGQSRRAA